MGDGDQTEQLASLLMQTGRPTTGRSSPPTARIRTGPSGTQTIWKTGFCRTWLHRSRAAGLSSVLWRSPTSTRPPTHHRRRRRGALMPESVDIVRYLQATYGQSAA